MTTDTTRLSNLIDFVSLWNAQTTVGTDEGFQNLTTVESLRNTVMTVVIIDHGFQILWTFLSTDCYDR